MGDFIRFFKTASAVLPLLAGLAAFSAAQVKSPDTLTYVERDDNDTLDPAWVQDTFSWNIIANLYEGLIGIQGESLTEFEPRLSTQVPSRRNGLISKDGLSYTFPIRPGVRFHSGGELTPEDVKYSLLRQLFVNCSRSSFLTESILGTQVSCDENGELKPGLFRRADSAIEIRKGAVVIRLATPFAPFLSILANSAPVLSKAWCVEHGEWDGGEASLPKAAGARKQDSYLHGHADGTGPFALERWGAREIVFLRNERYWRAPARLKRVVIKAVPELNVRRLMLQNGDADVMAASIVELPQVQNIPGVRVIEGLQPLLRNPLLFFNFKINPEANPDIGSGKLDGRGIPPGFFTDIEVRRAFAHAVDYPTYIREVLRGRGRPASGFIPPGLIGYSREGLNYRFDPALAAAHFKKAFAGKLWQTGFHFTILINSGSAWRPALVQIIKDAVESINPKFKINVRAVQWSTFLDQAQKGAIPLYIQGEGADYPDTHAFARAFLHSMGSFQKRMGYSSAAADSLIEKASAETDPRMRENLYRRLQRMAYDDIPFVPIVEPDGDILRVQRSWVQGYKFNPVFPAAPSGSYYYDLWKEEPK